jgi:hypothetical protein
VLLAVVDFVSAAQELPVIPPQHVAAGAALCAGFLCFRALALGVRAEQAPHVDYRGARSN